MVNTTFSKVVNYNGKLFTRKAKIKSVSNKIGNIDVFTLCLNGI